MLNEVVEIPPTPPGETPAERAADAAPAPVDKRKQLQVALYLRLRQRLDQELQAALAANSAGAGSAVDQAMARLARELRNALPAIVREAVEQVFAPTRNRASAAASYNCCRLLNALTAEDAEERRGKTSESDRGPERNDRVCRSVQQPITLTSCRAGALLLPWLSSAFLCVLCG